MRVSSCLLALLPSLLLLLGSVGSVDLGREHDLVGWLGETYEQSNATSASASEQPSGHMLVLSWEPRIFLYKGFLTDAECDELIAKAKPSALSRGEGDVVKRVEERISRWSMTHVDQGDGIQVRGEDAHQPHHDDDHGDDSGSTRLCTALMYLSSVEEGGETVFPKLPVPKGQTKAAGYSGCAMKGLAHKPQKGDALLFWSLRSDGTADAAALPDSCPLAKGQSWSATKRIYVAKRST